jgi:hypothetical protein
MFKVQCLIGLRLREDKLGGNDAVRTRTGMDEYGRCGLDGQRKSVAAGAYPAPFLSRIIPKTVTYVLNPFHYPCLEPIPG